MAKSSTRAKAAPSLPAAPTALDAAEAIEWARLHPVEWCKTVLRVTPDPWQAELLEAVADLWRKHKGLPTRFNHEGKNLITVRAMHGPGKTFGCALLMNWFGSVFETLSPCTAPKEAQLTTRLWPAFRKAMRNAVPGYASTIKVDRTKITWHGDEDWAFLSETAAQPENLAGFHSPYLLAIVEEASGVPEEIFPVLEGTLSTGTLVCMVLIGNPTRNVGTFYESHMRDAVAKHYYRIHVTLDKTTRVSPAWVKRMVEKYGEDSPVVQVRCYGNFATMDQLQLIALQWIIDAFDRELVLDGSTLRTRLSVDVADGGEDASVITLADHYAGFVYARKQWQHHYPASKAPILLADEVERLWNELKLSPASADIVVDALGVGAGTAGALMLKGLPVIAYKGGEASADGAQWRNRRVQSHIAMRNDFRDGRIVFAPDFLATDEERAEFEAQCCSIRMRLSTERVDDLEPKESMRRLGLKSPDRAESLAMQYAGHVPSLEGRAAGSCLNGDGELLTSYSAAAGIHEGWDGPSSDPLLRLGGDF